MEKVLTGLDVTAVRERLAAIYSTVAYNRSTEANKTREALLIAETLVDRLAALAEADEARGLDVATLSEAIRLHAVSHRTRSRSHVRPFCADKIAAEYERLAAHNADNREG